MEELHIAICEDTQSEEEKLLALLEQSEIPNRCTVFTSGEALLEAYQPQTFDLLLMDIYMGGMTGVQAVTKIRELDEEIPIAFITTSTDHTLESYRLSALKYIEKPFQKKDIEEILKLAQLKKRDAPSLVIHRNGKAEKILFSQILYLEQQTHQVMIYLKSGETMQVYDKLSAFSPQLVGQAFFTPHKSFSVNLAFVRMIDIELKCFVMQNNKNVPIRRESMGKAKKAYEGFLFGRTRGITD
ncbi:LytTR family DNA-binding domain-containing protein [Anaerotignum sp.]|uniref:LytTR family DNA-binding domain-containing protein n=1 Tax=Anaerotignum sp. TaxID=2039241 RepID=UPI0028AA004F|nr:LytTR family DNA-binding domain-containing protein [Anaerotignum sp.]